MKARQRAFTLLEVMVALAIFAVCALVLLQQSGRSSRQLYLLESRTLATWLAENQIATLRLGGNLPASGRQSQQVVFAGREWLLTTEIESTIHPGLRRISLSVSATQSSDSPYHRVTAFLEQQ